MINIPENCTKIVLNHWGCGDECFCHRMELLAYVTTSSWSIQVWESMWWNESLEDWELEELRDNVRAVCNEVGITADLTSKYPMDWFGEIIFPCLKLKKATY